MLNKNKIHKLFGDSMGSLIVLKNMLIFSAVLLSIGSVSSQQAFAGFLVCDCNSLGNGDWNSVFDCGVPSSSENVCIVSGNEVQLNGVGEANNLAIIDGSLLIGCDGDLTAGEVQVLDLLTNHGSVDANFLLISQSGLVQNSSSSFTFDSIQGTVEDISTICSQPIGGTVGSLDTATLLVAGAQANMGLWSLALVGIVGAGAAITYKIKSKKTEQ